MRQLELLVYISLCVCDVLIFFLFSFPCIKVRQLGRILNVPESFLKRHPFPGPGLAVRVLGDVTQGNALEILRQVHGAFVIMCVYNLYLPIVFKFKRCFSRLMRFSFSQSRMLVFMIQYGKPLQFSCLYDLLEFKVIKEHIPMLLLSELLQVKME